MKSLSLLALLWICAAVAQDTCESKLSVRWTADAIYINRWALPPGVSREVLMNSLINAVDAGRPIVIYDTNPNAALWSEANIVRPGDDQRFTAATYDDLSAADRDLLFSDFLARADRLLTTVARPILIVDHHFDSRLLATTSATPLTLDFLNWLNAHPPGPVVARVRAAFAHGMAVRDHSDADIVLANFVGRLAERPVELARWGPLVRQIALYNDHAELPAERDPRALNRVLLGYAFMNAFEKHIEDHAYDGYDFVLAQLPAALELVERASVVFGEAPDVVAAFLKTPGTIPAALDSIVETVRRDWEKDRALTAQIDAMLASGRGVRRVGGTLFVDLPPAEDAASGLAIMRLVERSRAPIARDVRTLVVIAREPGANGVVTHVKLRAIAADVNFDAVLAEIRALGHGGGGRGRAAGMYSSAGRVVSDEDLRRDLEWLAARL